MSEALSIIVVGATGDLARRKLFPALFACYARGQLPENVRFVGLARTEQDDAAFRGRLAEGLTCEEIEAGVCSLRAGEFLRRCHYRVCAYDSAEGFRAVDAWLTALEGGSRANRLIYLAVPPFVFEASARAMADGGFLPHDGKTPWTRLVVEKPFGRDRASYDELQRNMGEVCAETQLFRIDHYLGKEVVQNLLVLRFANTIFEPLWHREHIRHVHIAWSETQGVAGRAGYFDRYGIVRDVMQNHLMQIFSLIAMERPASLEADAIRDAKVAVLRQIPPLPREDLVIGQYTAHDATPGYLEEQGVAPGSRTPTYAAAVLYAHSRRWQDVPFLLTAGKGLRRGLTEVRIHFRDQANLFDALFPGGGGDGRDANELIIRVQPDEKLALRIVSKIPGVGMRLGLTELDLRFRARYAGVRIADAYENLLLDAIRGDRSLFIRNDELEAAWDIFTPALQTIEARGVVPDTYPFGSCGVPAVRTLGARHNIPDANVIEECGGQLF